MTLTLKLEKDYRKKNRSTSLMNKAKCPKIRKLSTETQQCIHNDEVGLRTGTV